ncbi:MAG: hypothetical protein C0469_08345 [Cyanobacteria bacterium DS2.3.42]|nr:hypothetical protein [Cyanobacteria bacterium DS2.3.42]
MNQKDEPAKLDPAEKQHLVSDDGLHGALELKPGTTIVERYRVLELLGKGGMGSVYKVEEINTGTKFALKFLDKQQSNDASWKRFENEIRAANKLDHPNLIKLHESGLLADGQPYFIMDLVEGESLSQILRKRGRLPLETVLKIFVQVGFALSYAHANGVIHRDIKPSNIMIQEPNADTSIGSVVKVVDFGIAKLTGQDEFNQQTLTKTGEIFGSPLYMSPEQCMGIAVDHRSDLYSMGCVIYEALTGAPPLVGDTALATMLKHQSEHALSLKEASMGIEFPDKVEQIVSKLLAKDIQERYQSAQLVTSHLVAFESAPMSNITATTSQPSAIIHEETFNKWLIAISAICTFVAGVAIGFFIPHPETITKVPDSSPADAKSLAEKVATANAMAERLSKLASSPGKFSTYTKKKGQRTFHFPRYSIGTISFENQVDQTAQGDLVSPVVFDGIKFQPTLETRNCPELFKKFREDDISFLDLSILQGSIPFIDNQTTSVETIIPYILHLKGIVTLSLDDATISPETFSKLQALPNLRKLWLARTNLTSNELSKASYLSRLEELCLESMNDVSQVIEKIGDGKRIQKLIVRYSNIEKDDIRKLSDCHSLDNLDLRNDKNIGDDCIPLLPVSLKMLSLRDCPITPKSIDSFKRLKNLKYMEITTATWSDEDINRLRQAVGSAHVQMD